MTFSGTDDQERSRTRLTTQMTTSPATSMTPTTMKKIPPMTKTNMTSMTTLTTIANNNDNDDNGNDNLNNADDDDNNDFNLGCPKRWRTGSHHLSNFLQITAIFSEFSVFQHSLRLSLMAQHFLTLIACDIVMTSIVVFAIISEQIQLQG